MASAPARPLTSQSQSETLWKIRTVLTSTVARPSSGGGGGANTRENAVSSTQAVRGSSAPSAWPLSAQRGGLTLVVTAEAELATRLVMASLLPVVQGAGAVAGVGSREGTAGSGRRPGRALRLLAVPPPAPAAAPQMLVAP